MSGTTSATLRATPVRSARAATFGRYPSSAAAARTASSVRAEMRPRALPESTSETVDCDTPARRATSMLVTRGGALISAILGAVDDLVEEVVGIGGRDLALLRPRDAEALLSEEAFEHEEFLPYWAELWPSALALARALASRALHGARTLELGCGLGLPSLAAAVAGGRVLATDWAPDAVAMTARNAHRNGLQI